MDQPASKAQQAEYKTMSIITIGNMPSLLKEGLYQPKAKKKTSVKAESVKKTNTKNKGN